MKRNYLVGKCLLQKLLDSRGRMSQVELAELTGITPTEINLYIHGERTMSLRNARRISVALNCRIDDLYDWKV